MLAIVQLLRTVLVLRNKGESNLPQVPKRAGLIHFLPPLIHSFFHSFIHSTNFSECLLYAGSLWKIKYEKALVPVLSSRSFNSNSHATSSGGRDAENGHPTGERMERIRGGVDRFNGASLL